MQKTIVFVTNQHRCDRLIQAARQVADQQQTDLIVIGVLDNEYTLNPEAVDYLFKKSKECRATMRLLFTEDKTATILEAIAEESAAFVVTGMPHSHNSVVYDLWRKFPNQYFYTVDEIGELIEVASRKGQERAASVLA